jgi:hypothetical protein
MVDHMMSWLDFGRDERPRLLESRINDPRDHSKPADPPLRWIPTLF